jgi:hypothetical protein
MLELVGAEPVPVACGPEEPIKGFNAFPAGWRVGLMTHMDWNWLKEGNLVPQRSKLINTATCGRRCDNDRSRQPLAHDEALLAGFNPRRSRLLG